ncbi:MAG: hypothetical protein A3F04_01420 [Candidatus Chisholmbacteria bacterium RIFCSPHIGHO2_12_FULL_49_9]|nr:MAG: hypothetical protein A3F04_01420 [Candidatus Chisholmbacteria bacterium RIFCSPHIGHO2_12_FULL_49_9]OGY19764.1 MAG: hypothetical protein A2900_01495 [Candidatus Chisholmbacteria bacterium RIFCSPLOWO2_01_FULL_50_28]
MKTVGEILKSARLKQGLKRIELAKKTRINLKYLQALENNEYDNLPEAAFVKGFIRNYANAVGLDPNQALAVFRRDYDQNIKGQVVPRELVPPSTEKRAIWTPKTTTIVGILSLAILLATYFFYQYKLLAGAPELEVIKPEEQARVSADITVEGKTDPQATLTINNQEVLVNPDGSFSQSLILPQGTRTITIKATSRSGKVRTIQRTITVVP